MSQYAVLGGVYGYSRCSLGPKYGWFFGCSELLQYNLFSLGYVKATAVALSIGLNTKFEFERVWVLFIYALLLGIHMIGSSLFWYSTSFLAVASVIILFMYLLATMISSGSMYNVPLEDRQDNYFNDGVTGFMSSFLYSVWLFSGSECITVAGTLINNVSLSLH
ncbi:amino acid permease [archaeon]|nr:MAG: amino acid permease [archaeon]